MPLSCWRERDGICWLAFCKLQNVFPCSFAQFAYRFQCFLLNQVRPFLNVLIFIFWSFTLLQERSGLVCAQLGFPPSKFADIPRCLILFHYRFIIPTSRFNRYRQFRGIVWLTKHMRIQSIHLGSWIMSVTIMSSNATIRLQTDLAFLFWSVFPSQVRNGPGRWLAGVYCEFHVIYGSRK